MSVHMYSGWRPEKTGWIFGLSGKQIFALGVYWLIPFLAAMNNQYGLFLLTCFVGFIWSGLVIWQPGGRSVLDWFVAFVGWNHADRKHLNRFQSKLLSGTANISGDPDLPGRLSRLVFHEGPGVESTRHICIIHDPIAGTYTVVAHASNAGIALESDTVVSQRVQARSALMAEGADDPHILRIVETIRTVPDDGTARGQWLDQNINPSASPAALSTIRKFQKLAHEQSLTHNIFISVVFDGYAMARAAATAGDGIEGVARIIQRKLHGLGSRLTAMGCTSYTWLDLPLVGEAISTGFSPLEGTGFHTPRGSQHRPETIALMSAAGPMGAINRQGCYVHDGCVSVSYRVILPKQQMPLDGLAKIMVPSVRGERRSVAIFSEAIDHGRAHSQVQGEIYKVNQIMDWRRRKKYQNSERHKKQLAEAKAQETKLAHGVALTRGALVLTVTVPVTENIEDACGAAEAAARGAKMRLNRLWLTQDIGFYAGVLPLGMGLERESQR